MAKVKSKINLEKSFLSKKVFAFFSGLILLSSLAGPAVAEDLTSSININIVVTNNHGGAKSPSDFTVTVNNNGSPAGSVSGNGSLPLAAGSYSITLNTIFGYGANFSGCPSGAVSDAQTIDCTINIEDSSVMIGVLTTVNNAGGGTKQPADFTISVVGNNPSVDSFPGDGTSGTFFSLDAGDYSVDGSTDPDYVKTVSPGCSGNLVIGVVTTKICFIKYKYFPAPVTPTSTLASLTVINHVINDNGDTFTAADFTAKITGTNVSTSTFASSETPGTTVTLDPGNFQAIVSGPPGYASTFSSGCQGSIAAGDNKTCTITTDDVAGMVVITTSVSGGTKQPGDFTIHLDATSPSLNDFAGSETGNQVIVDPGTFSVNEADSLGYDKQLGPGCSGVIHFAQVINCDITNTFPDNISSAGSASGSGSTDATLTLTFSKGDNDGSGSITGDGINCDALVSDSDCSETYASGTVISLTAVPHEGSSFIGSWTSGPCAGTITNPCQFTIGGSMSINAHFSIAAPASPAPSGGSGSGSGGSGGSSGGTGGTGGGSGGGGGCPGGICGSITSLGSGNVLAANTSPSVNTPSGLTMPQGQVKGASTTLPRTGMPVSTMLLIFSLAAALLNKKLKLV